MEAVLKLREFATETSEDGERIVRVSGRVSTHDDPEQQKEWIAFQLEIDEPTALNGALLRSKVLEQVRERLFQPKNDYEQIGDKYRS